jgi:hypothetical protein
LINPAPGRKLAGKRLEGDGMAGEDASAELDALIAQCTDAMERSKRGGRRYYFAGYGLMLLSVVGSIGAGVLALWSEVDRALVGTIALLPALCATVAGQLRLIEKGNWYYLRHRETRALIHRITVARHRASTVDTLAACYADQDDLDGRLGDAWSHTLSFSFTKQDKDLG